MTPFRIAGYGQYLPRQVRTSPELDAVFGESAGWTAEKFGIQQRHVAGPDETSSFGARCAGDGGMGRG
jgi:3-oxoacyl-[acyl-carrier-protein] synthase III